MRISESQFQEACRAYDAVRGLHMACLRAAIESLPEPVATLRPVAEMPCDCPDGFKRCFWGAETGMNADFHRMGDTHYIDIRLPSDPSRDAFEKWAKERKTPPPLDRDGDGYKAALTDLLYERWQAAKGNES